MRMIFSQSLANLKKDGAEDCHLNLLTQINMIPEDEFSNLATSVLQLWWFEYTHPHNNSLQAAEKCVSFLDCQDRKHFVYFFSFL